MDIKDMIDFISKVGFPVSMAAFLVFSIVVNLRKDLSEMKDSLSKAIDRQTETLHRVLEEVIKK